MTSAIEFKTLEDTFRGEGWTPQHAFDTEALLCKWAKRVGGHYSSIQGFGGNSLTLNISFDCINVKLIATQPRKNSNIFKFSAIASFTACGFVFENKVTELCESESIRINSIAEFKKEYSKLATRTKKVAKGFVRSHKKEAKRNEDAKNLYMLSM